MEVTRFWTKTKLIIIGSILAVIGIVVAIIFIHRNNLRKEYMNLEKKINNSVVTNHLAMVKIELKDNEYRKIDIRDLYKSNAMSGTYNDACEGYVIAEKTEKGIVSKTYLKCGSIYTTPGYGSTSTKSENTTVSQADNDTEPPTIKLNGSDTMTVELNKDFVDPGVTVFDNVDKKPKVKTSGEVNTKKEGTYKITYTATDSSGNKASVERTVIVKKGAEVTKDTEAPKIVFTNPETYQNICIGETVNISKDGVYGYRASDNVDGDLTGSVKIEGPTGPSTSEGKFTLVYKVKDKAGNEGTATREYGVINCSSGGGDEPSGGGEWSGGGDEPSGGGEWSGGGDEPSGGGSGGGGSINPSGNVQPTGISVDDSVYVKKGHSVNLNARVIPDNASDTSLTYSVSNSNIATVSGDGTVTGVNVGDTRVTIRTSNGKTVGVYIYVEP